MSIYKINYLKPSNLNTILLIARYDYINCIKEFNMIILFFHIILIIKCTSKVHPMNDYIINILNYFNLFLFITVIN